MHGPLNLKATKNIYAVIHANVIVYTNIYLVSKLKVLLNNINTPNTECIRGLYPCMFPKTNRRKGCHPVPQQRPIGIYTLAPHSAVLHFVHVPHYLYHDI